MLVKNEKRTKNNITINHYFASIYSKLYIYRYEK